MKFTKVRARLGVLVLHLTLVLPLTGCSVFHSLFGNDTASLDNLALANSDPASLNPYLLNRKSVPGRAQQQFDQALAAMRLKQWSRAESILKLLNADYPELSGPWLNLGITYIAMEREGQAEAAFKQAIAVNPDNLDAYNQLAALYRRSGDFRSAEGLYKQALAIWPQHAPSHLNLGILYDIYLGELAEAADHYRAYQALQPEPDRRVAGWLLDLERQPAMLARAGEGS